MLGRVRVSFRLIQIKAGLLSIAALLIAFFYMEGHLGLPPCPLCMVDRVLLAIFAAVALLAAGHNPSQVGQRVYVAANAIICSAGMLASGRHIWLQSLPPDKVPGCTPDLSYLIDRLPLEKVITTLLNSAGECAEVSWTFLGMSIPQQTLLLFMTLFLLSLGSLFKTR